MKVESKCDCYRIGTKSCSNNVDGFCKCNPGYEGSQCDRCDDIHKKNEQGKCEGKNLFFQNQQIKSIKPGLVEKLSITLQGRC